MKHFLCCRFFMLCLLLLFIGIFAAGCSNLTNKLYLFKSAVVDYDWGNVGGKMNESYTSTATESIASSPYELSIAFRQKSKDEGSVTLKSVELTDAEGKITFYKDSEPRTVKFTPRSYDRIYKAYFFIKDLKPDYVRLKLRVKYKIETDKFTHEGETILYFDTAYKEYRSNKYWDMLMGV